MKKPKKYGISRKIRRAVKGSAKAKHYAKRSYDRMVKALGNPRGKRRLSAAPILKVAREAGARKVQVMRNKSGKPTGVKFLR